MMAEVELYSMVQKMLLSVVAMVKTHGYYQAVNRLSQKLKEELRKPCRAVMKWTGYVHVKKVLRPELKQNLIFQKPDHLMRWLLWVFLLSDFRGLTKHLNGMVRKWSSLILAQMTP